MRVVPNAKKREIIREENGLRVKLTAPPVEGKANEELIVCLSEAFGIRKSQVRIVRGERGRNKVVSLPVEEATLKNFQGT